MGGWWPLLDVSSGSDWHHRGENRAFIWRLWIRNDLLHLLCSWRLSLLPSLEHMPKLLTYLCLFSYSGEELSRLSDVLCAVPGVPVCFAVSPLELYFDKLYWAEKRVFLWVCASCALIIGVRAARAGLLHKGGQGRSRERPWHRLADRGTACRVWAPELGAGDRVLQPSLTWWAKNLVLAGGLVRSERIQRQDSKQGCDVDLPRGQGCGRACQWHSLSRDWRPRAELGPTSRGPGWGWLGPVKPTSAFRPR